MIIQSKHVNIEAKTYAYVNSRQEIYFLKILYDPIKIYMIHEGLLKYWMSGNALETVNQPEINFSTHAVAYENDCVAILFTNNTLRFITDFDKTHDIQYDDKHFDQFNVVKIFYLTYANYLVINTTRGMCIFINKQGKIEAIQKTGLIENYTLLPKIPTGFFTYKDGTLLLITKNEQKTVMTVNPRYREYPKIVLDKLRKKVIICK